MKLDRYESCNGARRRLQGRTERRGSQTGIPTWGMFLFGIPFAAAGAAIMLVGTRVIRVDPSTVHAPYWVLTAAGAVFALGGLMVWGMAGRQWAANRRRLAATGRQRDEPALRDYDWDTRGFEAPRWKRAAGALGGAAFLTLFLSMFNYWAFGANGPWVVKAVVVLFDLILAAVWWYAFVRLGRALKFGGSRVVFGRFPYRVSEPISIQWQPATGIRQPRKGTFTLRCVEAWFERHGSGRNRSVSLVHEELWSGTWHVESARELLPGKFLTLPYEPPADAPSTRLSGERPVFWEFEVKLDLPGLDFEETYLVPVYAKA